MAMILLSLAAYLACGFLFAVPFVLTGVKRIDPHAAHGSWGFRILIFPGTIFPGPLLENPCPPAPAKRPEERNSHRSAAREVA